MAKPFFSIIIPTLNEAKYLPHLLKDLSQQTFQDFEVIIVDAHSSDQTTAKAKGVATKLPSLKIILSEKRHVCAQRNLGAEKAQADILIFSDADNRLPPYFLQGIKYRWESEKTDILTTWFKPDKSNPPHETIATGMNIAIELQNISSPTFILESLIVINKQVFQAIGGFDHTIDYAEGKQFMQRAKELGKTLKTYRDPVYFYSFRRFRKYGTANLISHTTQLALLSLLGKQYRNRQAAALYPMLGGAVFTKRKKVKSKFQKIFTKLLSDINSER